MSVDVASTEKVLIPLAPVKLDEEEWMKLELPLQAAITTKKCMAAYSATPEADLAATKAGYLSNAQQAANKRNQDCIQVFITCFQNNTKLMTEVMESKTIDWPYGCTWIVVQFINDKYKAIDGDAEEDKMNKLNEISMEVTKDPENLFNQIRTVNAIYLTTTLRMTNEEKFLHTIA